MDRRQAALAAGALVLIGSTCDAPAQRSVVAQPAAAPQVREIDPAIVARDPGSPVGRVLVAIEAGDFAAASARADEALRTTQSLEEAGRLRWLLARAATELGPEHHATARRELEMLAGVAAHPLARWARLLLAELELGSDSETAPTRALALFDPLRTEWAGRDRAELGYALALARAGRHDEAVPALRAIVAATPDRVGAATAGMPLAEILAGREDAPSREEALALYRRIATRAPLATVGQEAATRADAVLASLPEERRAALTAIPFDDRFARAEALYNATRYDLAEEDLASLVAELTADTAIASRCRARLLQGKAMLRRRERDRGATHMEQVAEGCADTDIRASARYHAGRAHAQRGRHERAIEQYVKLEEEAPSHRLADDARFRAALSARESGDDAAMAERLSTLPEAYPQGDMRGDARFLLAWRARASGEHEEALAQLDASIAEGPQEDAEDIRGRAAYWRARTLRDLGRDADAVAAYVELVRAWPLSYYAQQAVARLDELNPATAADVRSAWAPSSPEPLVFPWRPEIAEPEWQTVLELLRVSAIDLAQRELEHAGALGEGADPDVLWLVAALLDRAGAHPEASLLVRRRLGSFMETVPDGRAHHMWRIAYPRAFHPLIERTAADSGVPAAFVRAVAREESAFNPNAVSIAHAYGLIQLIEPTARRFGNELGLPSDPASLRRPEINVPIGARFIAFLFDRYESNPAIVPSAYNAGEGAADRWLRARPDVPLDVFIEDIPYDETRRYTRRVLQTYGVYSWLDTGELPPLRRELPEP